MYAGHIDKGILYGGKGIRCMMAVEAKVFGVCWLCRQTYLLYAKYVRKDIPSNHQSYGMGNFIEGM